MFQAKETLNSQKSLLFTRKRKWDPSFPVALLVFLVGALVLYVISHLTAVSEWFAGLFSVFSPVIAGAIIAYFCNPLLRFFERRLFHRIRSQYVKRMLSILLTYLFAIFVIAVVCLLIIPQLISSIKELISQYDNYIANAVTYVNELYRSIVKNLSIDHPDFSDELVSLEKIKAAVQKWIDRSGNLWDTLLNYFRIYISKLVSGIANLVIAIFISFYILFSKDKRLAQINKILTALCTEKQKSFIFHTATLADNTFGKYIVGSLLDSVMVGLLSFIILSIFRIPYTAMIATIIGMTNIIPFFGPFIGAIPSAFIIFIADPRKVLTFVIIIFVVQQIEGNMIAPRILGGTTGISSLCVLIAITVMGSFWGIIGMVVGVPLFAVLTALTQQFLDQRLSDNNLSSDLDAYYPQKSCNEQGKPGFSLKYYLALFKYYIYGKWKKHAHPCRNPSEMNEAVCTKASCSTQEKNAINDMKPSKPLQLMPKEETDETGMKNA